MYSYNTCINSRGTLMALEVSNVMYLHLFYCFVYITFILFNI